MAANYFQQLLCNETAPASLSIILDQRSRLWKNAVSRSF